MTIGDINSNARGSGARFNSGKMPVELIPLRVIADWLQHDGLAEPRYIAALHALGRFQEGEGFDALLSAIGLVGPAFDECAAVFDYGRRKYAEWNWAKGMQWSVPLACAARHLLSMINNEATDPESGHPHRGHFLCNVVMLLTFARTYPEGDDRPSQWLRDPAMTERAAREEDARLIEQSNSAATSARRFRYKDGFLDDTDYIQIEASGAAYIVLKNGYSHTTIAYDLDGCLSLVKQGTWVELEAA